MAFPLTSKTLADVIYETHDGGYFRQQFNDIPNTDAFFFAHRLSYRYALPFATPKVAVLCVTMATIFMPLSM
jgi:hypothetical protein